MRNEKEQKLIENLETCCGMFDYLLTYEDVSILLNYIYKLELKLEKKKYMSRQKEKD